MKKKKMMMKKKMKMKMMKKKMKMKKMMLISPPPSCTSCQGPTRKRRDPAANTNTNSKTNTNKNSKTKTNSTSTSKTKTNTVPNMIESAVIISRTDMTSHPEWLNHEVNKFHISDGYPRPRKISTRERSKDAEGDPLFQLHPPTDEAAPTQV